MLRLINSNKNLICTTAWARSCHALNKFELFVEFGFSYTVFTGSYLEHRKYKTKKFVLRQFRAVYGSLSKRKSVISILVPSKNFQ